MTRRTRLQCISIRGLLAALFFALMPIAHASLFSDGEARDQIAAERARLDDALKQLDALNTRLSKVEDQLKSGGLLDLQSQLDQLRQDLADLRGQIEVINNNIQSADKRQRDMYIDLDTRLRHLEQPGATNGTPNGTAEHADSEDPTDAGASGDDVENETYEAAQQQRRIGNYQGAITAFQSFIKKYPQSSRAPRAQYWIGDSYFNLRDFKSTIANQEALIKTYSSSSSVPDAMLNIASAQLELGETAAAKKTLQELIAKYPISEAADKGKQRLQALDSKQ